MSTPENREATTAAPRADSASFEARRQRRAWLFLLPTLVVVAFIALYPLAQTFYLSFTNARLGTGEPATLVGAQNYVDLVQDSYFHDAVLLTVFFTVVTVLSELALGLGIALLVNSQFKGRSAVRAAMLIPWAIPTVISAQMWKWMYNDVYGVFNDLLVNRLGVLPRNVAFVADPDVSFWAVAIIDIWKTTPFMALLLLAGLQLIPSDLYEAARVDGATPLQQFTRITLPLLKPSMLVALIFRTLDALRVFDVFFVMFGNRPDMQTMATYAQQTLVSVSNIGYGSAISVALFLIIAVFILIYLAVFRTEEA
ncbi:MULTISPECIES: carbohydrate ABC transporter permease [Sorangium]|uniref:Sugar ABC transporter permease n=1 Tax=Sorangium cellulosum TaxID=56 RepID=A0A4V0NGU7_SORCE|nr:MULTISPECIES: sugar ABC transporter permease [Sorangium]AUX34412.1 sugar ABC transporter permease [Sorangium cellulosum]WCQ93728.1 Trehalose transport system permease protein SugA [Sorangium sp. Soce836]